MDTAALKVSRRYVGEEPYRPSYLSYNRQLKELLPQKDIGLVKIACKEVERAISTGRQRSAACCRGILSRSQGG